ncbi:hypothetical protein GCM10011571_07540 [Marinithermofilum abyssi]|uniref:Uncharacterized protein n=1 Tax=Marinithermofilum abyssi TaxID=1571185 RepID=A0A8J2VGE1_9BACL|nr:hypothetical protein [Marinithermofilum abyssi]GGE08739.1 hypothetical protein GCM10011571_07540 [Marinithermofilum abyssi]
MVVFEESWTIPWGEAINGNIEYKQASGHLGMAPRAEEGEKSFHRTGGVRLQRHRSPSLWTLLVGDVESVELIRRGIYR